MFFSTFFLVFSSFPRFSSPFVFFCLVVLGSSFTTTELCKASSPVHSAYNHLGISQAFISDDSSKPKHPLASHPSSWLGLFLGSVLVLKQKWFKDVFPILLKVTGFRAGGLQPLSPLATSQWVDRNMPSSHKRQEGARQEGLDLKEFYLINLPAKAITSHSSDSYPPRSCFLCQTVKQHTDLYSRLGGFDFFINTYEVTWKYK